MSCQICLDKYTKNIRKEIKCLHCNESFCRSCHQNYILLERKVECPICKKTHDLDFLKKNQTKTFIMSTGKFKNNGMKEVEMDIYYNKELQFFHDTQKLIFEESLRKEITDKCHSLTVKMVNIRYLLQNTSSYNEILKYNRKFLDYEIEYKKQKRKLHNINDEIDKKFNSSKKRKIVLNCSNCSGYLDSNWNCSKCNKQTCEFCRDIKEDNHVCNKDNKDSIEFINSTTKDCPDCSVKIYKTDGCDQMWCPKCKIVFSYNTGMKQIGGLIHQPDALEDIRKKVSISRNPSDIQCGGVYDYLISNSWFKNIDQSIKSNKDLIKKITSIIRFIIEYEDLIMRNIQNNDNDFKINIHERKLYLKGELSKDKFKSYIYNQYKYHYFRENEKKIESGLYLVLSDEIRSIIPNNYESLLRCLNNCCSIFEIYNIEFNNIADIHNKTKNKIVIANRIYYKIDNKTKNKYISNIDYDLKLIRETSFNYLITNARFINIQDFRNLKKF